MLLFDIDSLPNGNPTMIGPIRVDTYGGSLWNVSDDAFWLTEKAHKYVEDFFAFTGKPSIAFGDAICVAHNVPTPRALLRNSYSLKRSPKDADVCVISSDGIGKPLTSRRVDIWKDNKNVLHVYSHHEALEATEDKVFVTSDYLYKYNPIKQQLIDIINSGKPTIQYNALPLKKENSLSFDKVALVYQARKDNENLLIALKSLNTFDYEKYPMTMALLGAVLRTGTAGKKFMEYSIPRGLIPLRTTMKKDPDSFKDTASKDDWELSQALAAEITGFTDAQSFTDPVNLSNAYMKINYYILTLFYDFTVRVRRRNYEQTRAD